MPRFLPDTSCMVAVLHTWHAHHERATREMSRRLDRGETLVIAGPALIETYSVLTRMPPPGRLSPADAITLIEANFTENVELVAVAPDTHPAMLRRASAQGIAGGRIYDFVIATCGSAAGVDALLTFNEQQFLAFATPTMQIVVPP